MLLFLFLAKCTFYSCLIFQICGGTSPEQGSKTPQLSTWQVIESIASSKQQSFPWQISWQLSILPVDWIEHADVTSEKVRSKMNNSPQTENWERFWKRIDENMSAYSGTNILLNLVY